MSRDLDPETAATAALELVDALLDPLEKTGKISRAEADLVVEAAAERAESEDVAAFLRLLREERRRRTQ